MYIGHIAPLGGIQRRPGTDAGAAGLGLILSAALLDTFDRQRQIDAAARLVARHLMLGHSPDALIATLAQSLLREDAGFHAY
jgi:hypothetical protein